MSVKQTTVHIVVAAGFGILPFAPSVLADDATRTNGPAMWPMPTGWSLSILSPLCMDCRLIALPDNDTLSKAGPAYSGPGNLEGLHVH